MHRVLWWAAVVTTLVVCIVVFEVKIPDGEVYGRSDLVQARTTRTVELEVVRDDMPTDFTITGIRSDDEDLKSDKREVNVPLEEESCGTTHDNEGGSYEAASRKLPQSTYTYRIPFGDGRRAVASSSDLFENTRAVYRELSAAILERWGYEYENTMFSRSMRFSDGGKVVEDKMINAVVEQGGFVAAFTGTSITAGHDCLYEQSYPILLNATMSRLFASAGVRFEAINVAMGNTPSAPYSYCVDAHAGIDADIISWEMAMMVADRKCGPAAEWIELFIRQATVLPRHPAVLVLESTPDQQFCPEAKLRAVAHHNSILIGDCNPMSKEQDLMSGYQQFGLHDLYMNQLISQFTCNDTRFARDDLFRYGKTYPHPARWHPGTHGHELMADVLFMNYAGVFLRALERLEAEVPGMTAQQLRNETESGKLALLASVGIDSPEAVSGNGENYMGAGRGDVLPNPIWCKALSLCRGAGDYRCSNTFSPLAGKHGSRLLDMVSERTPLVNIDKKQNVASPTEGHWAVTLDEVKPNILRYLKQPLPERFEGMHKPIDMKWVLVGDSKSGAIEFEFETKGLSARTKQETRGKEKDKDGSSDTIEDPRVVVCKARLRECAALEDKNRIRYRIDGNKTSVLKLMSHHHLPGGYCALLAARIGVGRHRLSVEPLRQGEPLVSISHMIYPA